MARENELKPARMKLHSVQIEDRARVSITDVSDVESFNETEVILMTSEGGLSVSGEDLHISRLNLDEGQLIIEGTIFSVEYAGETHKGGLFSKMFR